MSQEETLLKEFRDARAVLHGHFLLSSGLHSDTYVQCAKVLECPDVAGRLCAELAKRWPERPSLVAGPAYGGILVAYELARALGARAVFFERVDGRFDLRRGFEIAPGERVLVSEDVVTTGGSAQEVVERVAAMGGTVVGVAALVDRSGGQAGKALGTELRALVQLTPPVWKPEECPLCRQGVPAVKPGSRPGAAAGRAGGR